jgi:HEAT repeat protein
LAWEKSEEALEQLEEMLSDADVSIRCSAVRVLGHIDGPTVIQRLVSVLSDSDSTVSGEAATALGRIHDSSTIPDLRYTLQKGSEWAGYALGIFEPPDLSGLKEALNHSDWKVRYGAIVGLEAAGKQFFVSLKKQDQRSADEYDAIVDILDDRSSNDEQREVRFRAFKAMNIIRGRGGTGGLCI